VLKGENMKILFICKERLIDYGVSTGLFNSATFVSNALNKINIESEVISVVDNNCIDREVHKRMPSCVVIEAFWVVPEKMEILCNLYPNIQWIVRGHSRIPFFANEGIAMKWMWEYIDVSKRCVNFNLSFNDRGTCRSLSKIFKKHAFYLPNIYCPPTYEWKPLSKKNKKHVNIGCFGAIRPLKNTLIQAIAAIRFADRTNKKLFFHINGTRLEQSGENVSKNLINLFRGTEHELVEYVWMPHDRFIDVVRTMDIGMQVSLSESFNIVAADFVSSGKPIVVSPNIRWASPFSKTNPNSVRSIVKGLYRVTLLEKLGVNCLNCLCLHRYNMRALRKWNKFNKYFINKERDICYK
jgi:hypothetical protein